MTCTSDTTSEITATVDKLGIETILTIVAPTISSPETTWIVDTVLTQHTRRLVIRPLSSDTRMIVAFGIRCTTSSPIHNEGRYISCS